MATANTSPSPAKTVSGGDPMAVFLGGAMLVLFALWLGKNHGEGTTHYLVLILAALGLSAIVLGIVSGMNEAHRTGRYFEFIMWTLGAGAIPLAIYSSLKLRNAATAADVTRIEAQRRTLGTALLCGGLVLAVASGYLSWKLRLPGLGESVGLALFALVPLIAGLVYLKPATSGEFMQKVLAWITLVQNALLLIGAAGLLAFLWLAFWKKLGAVWFPELGALLFQSLLCATTAFWLISSQPAERTEFAVRCLLLIFGAVTGFILVVLAGIDTYLWRQDVLLGGVSAWQGANGYKFWICAYLFLVGLVVMFTSLLLARSEARGHAILRQSLYGYSAVVNGLLVLVFLGTLNVVCYAMFPMTFEWTRTRALTTLSKESKRMLSSLTKPTTVFVLLPRGHEIYHDMESLLSNCMAQTDKLQVQYVSPDTDQKKFNDLAVRFPELLPSALAIQRDDSAGGRGLLIVYGALPADVSKKVPHDFVAERKLFDKAPDFGGGEPGAKPKFTLTFKGEEELMASLKHLVYGKETRTIYFLQGDDELDINVPQNATQRRQHLNYTDPMSIFGAGSLVDHLKKDGYKVSGLSFRRKINEKTANVVYVNESGIEKRYDVPDDAWVVIIAGASKEIPPEGLEALERFVEAKKGKLLVTVDVVAERSEAFPLKKSGIESFLLKYGVGVEDNFVMRLIRERDDDASVIVGTVPAAADNEMAKQFSRLPFQWRSVRVVRPSPKGGKFRAETLLEADPEIVDYLEESSVKALQAPWPFLLDLDRQRLLGKRLLREPLPIAVTVSESDKPKMVVFGDTDFLSNLGMASSRDGELNYSMFVSSLEWMAERQAFIGPQKKVTKSFSLPSSVEVGRMIFMPTWFMLIGSVSLGIGIWLIRRR